MPMNFEVQIRIYVRLKQKFVQIINNVKLVNSILMNFLFVMILFYEKIEFVYLQNLEKEYYQSCIGVIMV